MVVSNYKLALEAITKVECEIAMIRKWIMFSDRTYFRDYRKKTNPLSSNDIEVLNGLRFHGKLLVRNNEDYEVVLQDLLRGKELVPETAMKKAEKRFAAVCEDDKNFETHLYGYINRCRDLNRKIQVLSLLERNYQKKACSLRRSIKRGRVEEQPGNELLKQRGIKYVIPTWDDYDQFKREYMERFANSYVGNVYKIGGKLYLVIADTEDTIYLQGKNTNREMNRDEFEKVIMEMKNNQMTSAPVSDSILERIKEGVKEYEEI